MVTATRDVVVAENILQRHDMLLHRERTKVLDFSSLANEVEESICANSGRSDSEQFEIEHEVLHSISDIIKHQIGQKVTHDCSWGTKISALKTIVKIGEIICEPAQDRFSHEIQTSFQNDDMLEDVMLRCVGYMSSSERMQLRELKDNDGSFFENLKMLQQEGTARCMFERLDEVIAMLSGHELAAGNPTPSSNNVRKREPQKAEDKVSILNIMAMRLRRTPVLTHVCRLRNSNPPNMTTNQKPLLCRL
jgi:hypothetical protein